MSPRLDVIDQARHRALLRFHTATRALWAAVFLDELQRVLPAGEVAVQKHLDAADELLRTANLPTGDA